MQMDGFTLEENRKMPRIDNRMLGIALLGLVTAVSIARVLSPRPA